MWDICAQLPFEAKATGKREESLKRVGVDDPSNSDEGIEHLAVGLYMEED